MLNQENFEAELKNVIEKNIISYLQTYIRDNDLYISPDFNIAHEVVKIIGDNCTYLMTVMLAEC